MERKKLPYRHRDLNWLSFNDRVLQEASDDSNPLYERIKFLSIFSSNLDEFFRVRVSQLRQLKKVKKSLRKRLVLHPTKLIKQILAKVDEQQSFLGKIFHEEIKPELKKNGIAILEVSDIENQYPEICRKFFNAEVKKHLKLDTVEASKSSKIFLDDRQLYFLVTYADQEKYGIVNIPSGQCGRFIELSPEGANLHAFAFLDDIVRLNLDSITSGEIIGIYSIKISRDAELYLDSDIEKELSDQIYESLDQRKVGQPTRLLYDSAMPKEVRKNLRKSLGLGKIDMVAGGRYHNFDDFMSLPDPTDNPELHADKLKLIQHKSLEASDNYFDIINEKDQLVHFPFMSFDYVQNFINQAAVDPDVNQIKISLYRVADESELTSALLEALKNGKTVTVFVEAKARFDEKNNIKWGRIFEQYGASVIYSYPKIKVHSKVLLVYRKENSKTKRYAYIGTGNFNAKTSKIYCDHGLFTAHKKITKDLHRVFSVLEGKLIIPRAKELLISPFSTRRVFEKMIHNEIENALRGREAYIHAKMNQLEDRDMIDLLYKASDAGVEIRLLVRGFTCLIPGLKGVSDNIQITSIVDRFLEHGRIYKFCNDNEPLMFMGSADWMSRNLDRRIEVLTPVLDKDIFEELNDILSIQFSDNVKARVHTPDETNPFIDKKDGDKSCRSQTAIYQYLEQKHS